jgi:hypothetical protein
MAVPSAHVEQVIACCTRATAANCNTASRRGNLIELTSEQAEEVMITADMHGNRLNFARAVKIADLANHPRRHLILQEVCHGGPTYPVGSGCMSHLLLEDVARLKATFPHQVHFLLSNHELAELTEYPIAKSHRLLNLTFRSGMQELYGSQVERVRDAYLRFVASCALGVRFESGIVITHSAPEAVDQRGFDISVFDRPLTAADLAPQGAAFKLVWGRDFRERNAQAFAELLQARVLIHGHEPCSEGYRVPNSRQVILDCVGPHAHYVLLPVSEVLTQAQVVAAIKPLWRIASR